MESDRDACGPERFRYRVPAKDSSMKAWSGSGGAVRFVADRFLDLFGLAATLGDERLE
jgi:hypothetical protein